MHDRAVIIGTSVVIVRISLTEVTLRAGAYVVPNYVNIAVPVRTGLLVVEAHGVADFVSDNTHTICASTSQANWLAVPAQLP